MSKQRSSLENFIRVQLFQGRACRFQRWNGSTPSTQRKSQDKVFFATCSAQLKLLIWFVALSCDGRSGGGTAQQFLLPSLCAHNHLAGKAGRTGNRLRRLLFPSMTRGTLICPIHPTTEWPAPVVNANLLWCTSLGENKSFAWRLEVYPSRTERKEKEKS